MFKRVEYTCQYGANKSILGVLLFLKASATKRSVLLKVIGTSLMLSGRRERRLEPQLPRAGSEV